MAVSIAILIAAAMGCGDNSESPTAAPAPISAEKSVSIVSSSSSNDPVDEGQPKQVALVNTPEARMVDVLVHSVVEPAEGSDEAAIIKVFESQVRALNLIDYASFLTTCDPRLAKPLTPEKLQFVWETNAQPFVPALSYNRRNAEIRLFDDDTAIVTSHPYSYGEPVLGEMIDSWVKVEGDWYLTSVWCHGGNASLK